MTNATASKIPPIPMNDRLFDTVVERVKIPLRKTRTTSPILSVTLTGATTSFTRTRISLSGDGGSIVFAHARQVQERHSTLVLGFPGSRKECREK